jgi:hypothetical protein
MIDVVKRHPERAVILSFMIGILLYLITGWFVLVDISCLPGIYMFLYGCNAFIKEYLELFT